MNGVVKAKTRRRLRCKTVVGVCCVSDVSSTSKRKGEFIRPTLESVARKCRCITMTDDTKEWVTIKIEAPVRDAAKDDARTYTEIMRAGLNADGDYPTDEMQVDPTAIPDDVREQLDRIESAAQTAEDRAVSIERTVEDMEGRMR